MLGNLFADSGGDFVVLVGDAMSLIDPKLARIWARIAAYKVFIVAGGLVVLFLFIAWQIESCRTSNYEKKKEEIKTNISTGKIESNIQQNTISEAANNSNKALENVNKTKGQNINSFGNSYNEARARYCAEFPEDCK